MSDESPSPSLTVAPPAPLGLAAFALTTFLLSVVNAGWAKNTSGYAWLGYALAYGGLVQLLAGMQEFKNKDVFGATAFSTYGGFWIGLGLYVQFGVPKATAGIQVNRDLAWILLAFAIFNTYMLIWSTQLNLAVFAVFATLELTEIVLAIANFTTKTAVLPPNASGTFIIGGIIGVITAAVAWYASAAGVINHMKGKEFLPVGKPLMKLG